MKNTERLYFYYIQYNTVIQLEKHEIYLYVSY